MKKLNKEQQSKVTGGSFYQGLKDYLSRDMQQYQECMRNVNPLLMMVAPCGIPPFLSGK